MAVFVDLDEEENEPLHDGKAPLKARIDAAKRIPASADQPGAGNGITPAQADEASELSVRENPNRNAMTQALGCYPIAMAVASSIDLNTLDNLSRTCRQIRAGLLQYRKVLLASTLHCSNDHLPVDPGQALRYRARAGNWFYMEDMSRPSYFGKPGLCARDLVAECRRCGTVVCRNCAIKPPAPIVLRDRHRRLCAACVAAPLGTLVKPPLGPEVRIDSDDMERAICQCGSEGVWLCQPCGRSIRSDDSEYKGIWRWRNQYTDVLSGIGTGIGEGDRGVICGRENECCAAREREQEMDGDAEDAREAETYQQQQQTQQSQQPSPGSTASSSSLALPPWTPGTTSTPNLSTTPNPTSSGIASGSSSILDRRTPSPALKPGYERHEIEGIGGVTKKLRLRMVKVGACVPEWDDERVKGEILGREVQGRRRSWCGWCRRVIPSSGDYERGRRMGGVTEEREGGRNGRENGKGKGREDGGGVEENGEENGGGKGKENEAGSRSD